MSGRADPLALLKRCFSGEPGAGGNPQFGATRLLGGWKLGGELGKNTLANFQDVSRPLLTRVLALFERDLRRNGGRRPTGDLQPELTILTQNQFGIITADGTNDIRTKKILSRDRRPAEDQFGPD